MMTPVDLRPERVADLAMIGDGMLNELAEMFRQQVANEVPPLIEAIRAGRASDTERLAHRLKGSASQIGMEMLTAYLEVFITMARIGEMDHVAPLLPGFDRALTRALVSFQALAP